MDKLARWDFNEVARAIRAQQGGGAWQSQGWQEDSEDYGGDYRPEDIQKFLGGGNSQFQDYLNEQMRTLQPGAEPAGTTPEGPAPGTPGNRAALGLDNLADVGRGELSDSGSSWKDWPMSVAGMLAPGSMLKMYKNTIGDVDQGNYGSAAASMGTMAAATAAMPKLIQGGTAVAGAALNAVKHPISTAQTAWNGVRSAATPGAAQATWNGVKPWVTSTTPYTGMATTANAVKAGQGALAVGKSMAQPFVQAGSTIANVGKAVVGNQPARAALAAMAPKGAGKILPGLGSGLDIASNLKGAITGDQGYLSESLAGQMGEQALRSAGQTIGAFTTNPLLGVASQGSTILNAGVNAWRAGSAMYDAQEAENAANAITRKNQGALDTRKAWMAENDANEAAGKPQRSYKEFAGKTPANPSAPAGTPSTASTPSATPASTASTPSATPASAGRAPAGTAAAASVAANNPAPAVPGAMPRQPELPLARGGSGETNTGTTQT